jgi:assimilatory nitrate reductase catalytic subunit
VGVHAELTGFLLAGDSHADAWIKPVLEGELPAQCDSRMQRSAQAAAPPVVIAIQQIA